MSTKLRIKYCLGSFPLVKWIKVDKGLRVKEIISLVADLEDQNVNQVRLNDTVLESEGLLEEVYKKHHDTLVFWQADSKGEIIKVDWVVNFRWMEEVALLGQGAYGSVALLKNPYCLGKIALKTFNAPAKTDEDKSEIFFQEIEKLYNFHHWRFSQIVGYSPATRKTPAQVGTIYAIHGSLREALHKVEKGARPEFFDETSSAIIIAGIVVGMKDLHSKGLIHGDLKPENVVINEEYYPRITDLGHRRFYELGLISQSPDVVQFYLAPELYGEGEYTAAVDVYSFALILYEVLLGKPVFDKTLTTEALKEKVLSGERPELPDSLNDTVKAIIQRNWVVDPNARSSFEEIYNDLYKIDFKISPNVETQKVLVFVRGHRYKPEEVEPLNGVLTTNTWQPKNVSDIAPDVPLDGIIASLTTKYGGNVHDKNIVPLFSSIPLNHDDFYAAKNIADFNDESYFCSVYREKNQDISLISNNWICYDFKSRRIIITHYAIRTNTVWGVNGFHLKNWLVEGSSNGLLWKDIDRKENNSELNASGVTRLFPVTKSGPFRFIRLYNIGRNWYGNDALAISAWELFGLLLEPKD